MIISNRVRSVSYDTDAVAQSVRGFAATSAQLQTRRHAAPSTGGDLNLVRLYPSVFSTERQPPPALVQRFRAASATLSGMAAVVAVIAAILHR